MVSLCANTIAAQPSIAALIPKMASVNVNLFKVIEVVAKVVLLTGSAKFYRKRHLWRLVVLCLSAPIVPSLPVVAHWASSGVVGVITAITLDDGFAFKWSRLFLVFRFWYLRKWRVSSDQLLDVCCWQRYHYSCPVICWSSLSLRPPPFTHSYEAW